MPSPRGRVIVNPVAGAGSARRKWASINRLLQGLGVTFDFAFTEGAGHASELAKAAADDGYDHIIAVGGDGTVNEVANGILASGGAASTALGIISAGTGSDFVRSAGIPRDYRNACNILTSPRRRTIDVGTVEFQKDGQRTRRFFLNAAGIGFAAAVVESTERFPKLFGGTVPYFLGLLRTFLGYRNRQVALGIGEQVETGRLLTVVVANGGYFGGGMHVAPDAVLNDSLFDVVVIGDVGKLDLLRSMPMVYKGTLGAHPKVRMMKSPRVTITSPERVLVHADGELLGEGPASFSITPQALHIIV